MRNSKGKQTHTKHAELTPGISFQDAKKGLAVIGHSGCGKTEWGMEACRRVSSRGGNFVFLTTPWQIKPFFDMMHSIGREDDLRVLSSQNKFTNENDINEFPENGKCLLIVFDTPFGNSADCRETFPCPIKKLSKKLATRPLPSYGGCIVIIDEFSLSDEAAITLRNNAARCGFMTACIGQDIVSFKEGNAYPWLTDERTLVCFKGSGGYDPANAFLGCAAANREEIRMLFHNLPPGQYRTFSKGQIGDLMQTPYRIWGTKAKTAIFGKLFSKAENNDEIPFSMSRRNNTIVGGINDGDAPLDKSCMTAGLLSYCRRILFSESPEKRIENSRRFPLKLGNVASEKDIFIFLHDLSEMRESGIAPPACLFHIVKEHSRQLWYAIHEILSHTPHTEARPLLSAYSDFIQGAPTKPSESGSNHK